MCFAGIEEDIKNLVQQVATKAEVNALDARIDHGHLHVLVEDRGWIRSTDLLESHADGDGDVTTHPITLRPPTSPAVVARG